MRSEELDQTIILQPLKVTKDSYGAEIQDYTLNNVSVRASCLASTGREFYAVQRINAEVEALFKIRYLQIDTTWRVKFGDRILNILFIDDTGRRKNELLLSCKEVV